MDDIMKTVIAAALVIATSVLLAAPALAQGSGPSSMDIEMERRKKADAEADRGYKNMLKQTSPAKETKTDPWGNARAPSPEKK